MSWRNPSRGGDWHSSWSRRQRDTPAYILLRHLSGKIFHEATHAWSAVYSNTLQCCQRAFDLTAGYGPIQDVLSKINLLHLV